MVLTVLPIVILWVSTGCFPLLEAFMALSVAWKQVPREGVFRPDPAEIIWVLGLKDMVSFAIGI